jgi:hypothetical protein
MIPSTSKQSMEQPYAGDMPIDPNEPTYCMCRQASFGKMVFPLFSPLNNCLKPKPYSQCRSCATTKIVSSMGDFFEVFFSCNKNEEN